MERDAGTKRNVRLVVCGGTQEATPRLLPPSLAVVERVVVVAAAVDALDNDDDDDTSTGDADTMGRRMVEGLRDKVDNDDKV